MKNNNCLYVCRGGVFKKLLFVLFLVLSVLSFAACESRVDRFVRLAVQDYRENNVPEEEFEELYEKLSESELEEAKIKIAKELGGDVFGGLFLQAMEMPAAPAVVPISEDYKEIVEELDWYQSLGEIQTHSSDPIPASVVVNLFLGYKKGDGVTFDEIQKNRIALRDCVRRYFSEKTVVELSPRNEDSIKIDLRNIINDTVLERGKIKKLSFDKLNVIVQD